MYKKHVRWLEIDAPKTKWTCTGKHAHNKTYVHKKHTRWGVFGMHAIKHMYTRNIQDGVSLAFAHTKKYVLKKTKTCKVAGRVVAKIHNSPLFSKCK